MKQIAFLFLIISAIIFIIGCGLSPEDAYREAEQKNTILAYKEFLKKFPGSKYKEKVETAINDIRNKLNQELLRAVDKGNLQEVKSLIKKGAERKDPLGVLLR